MSKLNDIKFDFIRYANCWEDADVLLQALDVKEGSRILSIASAGDNSFSLLMGNPSQVVAVDVNPVQLWLTELKMVAIKKLNRHEFLSFAGFTDSKTRLQTYHSFKSELSADALAYWETNTKLIEEGMIYQGKFEKYFLFFSKKLLPLMQTSKRRSKLFETKSEEEQVEFYKRKWNNLRWKFFFRIFFSRFVMGRFGRDPKFMKHVKTTVSEYIYNMASKHLSSVSAQDNYMLHFIIKGNYGNLLPHYVREENYEIIRNRIHNIKLEKGFAQEIAAKYEGFDGFNLSNIFEYMDEETFKQVSAQLIQHSNPGAKLAYWNLMVPRNIASVYKENAIRNEKLSSEMTIQDKGFFYGGFCLDEIKTNKV